MSAKQKDKGSFKRLLYVWIAVGGMMFASFGPAIIGTLVAELNWKNLISMNSAEEETEENEGRGNNSNPNRLLEEETKHFYEWDFAQFGFVAVSRHEDPARRDVNVRSQHHPNIVIPPPERA